MSASLGSLDPEYVLRKKRSLRRELKAKMVEPPGKRIAILGGSTTAELKDMLELFLLESGIQPEFYESEYNKYYEDVLFDESPLANFKPDFIYIHTSSFNLLNAPSIADTEDAVNRLLDEEVRRYTTLWDAAARKYGCPVIQNNFDLPSLRVFGNMDCQAPQGLTRYIMELNRRFADEAHKRRQLYIHDIHYLSAWFGLERWHDAKARHAYKYAMSLQAMPLVARSISGIVNSLLGKSKKCLVLDLDNTLWGGVIGDDGLGGIALGSESAVAEGYTEFQRYLKRLKNRGILLSVCSKNDDANAREGFSHPDSVLTLEDFSAFQANWDEKHENVRRIAERLNIGIDSLVFVDDNPAEREIVRAQLPMVAVPEIGDDITTFASALDRSGYFEPVSLSEEDIHRASFYTGNAQREQTEAQFANYDDFLRSLSMEALIAPVSPLEIDRVVQLCNKTNQFNATTRRVTVPEMERMIADPLNVTIFGRLKDKFGDNGLISVMSGDVSGQDLHLTIWLMSCRVLKRQMENAMLDSMVEICGKNGVRSIVGYYQSTAKNGMVADLFARMGFREETASKPSNQVWRLDLAGSYENRNSAIKVNHGHG